MKIYARRRLRRLTLRYTLPTVLACNLFKNRDRAFFTGEPDCIKRDCAGYTRERESESSISDVPYILARFVIDLFANEIYLISMEKYQRAFRMIHLKHYLFFEFI